MESWNKLQWLHQKSSLPWICAGDFNEILKSQEKLGGKPRPNGQMQDFRDVLDECGFTDMGYVGNKYTWYKHYQNGNTIWGRLDKAIATQDWLNLFPASKVLTFECGTSDHKPIIIHPMGIPGNKQRPWRFEQVWLDDDGCHETVHTAWRKNFGSFPMTNVVGKINKCQSSLQCWSKQNFGNITRQIAEKKRQLKQAERVAAQENNFVQVQQLKHDINGLLVAEEKLWHQRSQSHWIK